MVALGFCRDSYTDSYTDSYKDSYPDSYTDSHTELKNIAVRFLCWDNYLTAWNKIRFLQGSKDSCPERAQGGHGESRGASRGVQLQQRDNNSHAARADSKGTSTLQNSRNL